MEKAIHALVFDPIRYDIENAVAWAERSGYHAREGAMRTETSIVVKQFDADLFGVEGTAEVVKLAPGVSAIAVGVKPGWLETVTKSFASNPEVATHSQSTNRENKEVFDGKIYSNTAPGQRSTVTEPKNVKKAEIEQRFSIAKSYAEKRIVIGAVYVPFDPNDPTTVDTHGHAASAEDIEKAAYEFMKDMNNYSIDRQHNHKPDYGYVVETYIAKSGDPLFKAGTWVLGVKVTCDETWEKIQSGEITGFSLGGSAILEEVAEAA